MQIGTQIVKVGASIGVAVFPDDAADIEALCIAADRRMYDDKIISRELPGDRRPARSESASESTSESAEPLKMIANSPKA